MLGGGLTRGAVIGKIRRLGFRKRETRQAAGLDVLRGLGSRPLGADHDLASSAACRRSAHRSRVAAAAGNPSHRLSGNPRLAFRPTACRWPIDDPGPGAMHALLFCAGPTTGGVYCPAHRSLAGRSTSTPVPSP